MLVMTGLRGSGARPCPKDRMNAVTTKGPGYDIANHASRSVVALSDMCSTIDGARRWVR